MRHGFIPVRYCQSGCVCRNANKLANYVQSYNFHRNKLIVQTELYIIRKLLTKFGVYLSLRTTIGSNSAKL